MGGRQMSSGSASEKMGSEGRKRRRCMSASSLDELHGLLKLGLAPTLLGSHGEARGESGESKECWPVKEETPSGSRNLLSL